MKDKDPIPLWVIVSLLVFGVLCLIMAFVSRL